MATGHHRLFVATGLGALVVIASFAAISFVFSGGLITGQTSSTPMATPANITLIKAGTVQALPYRSGIPVCYDNGFNLSGSGTLSGGLKATGLINWYILSESQGPPLSGTIVSGTITQNLSSGSYVLEFCNQQRSSLNLTIVESFVVEQA